MLKGNTHTDHRGAITFYNAFDMSEVVRMYSIQPKVGVIRAWQGHKKETKWFIVQRGTVQVKVRDLETAKLVDSIVLDSDSPKVLKINPGFYNGFEALEENSLLLVFSDLTLQESQQDDFRKSLEELPW